ncbi:MAG: hypothetical protein NC184_03160 [Roseburia sp.]|nr:hypothetical protein [Roseburia sp.]
MNKRNMTDRKKLLIYKIVLFIFAFIVAFLPSTFSRSREVNSRVIVEILGIDGGDGVEVTAQYIMPADGEGATSKDTVTVKADTLTEAVESLNTALGRRAELGHCSLVIAGEAASPELLGTLMTATDVTADVYVSAAMGKASDLVSDITDFMKKTGATDADFIAYSAKKAHIATNTILGFLSDIGSASHTAYMPVVQMLESSGGQGGGEQGGQGGGESSDGGQGGEQSGESGGESSGDQTGMQVEKLALYGEKGRIGVLDRVAARGVAWVSARVEKSVVTADIELDGETVKNVTGRLLKKRAHIDIDDKSRTAVIKLKVTIEPIGDKYNILEASYSDKTNAAVKGGFKAVIEKEIRAAYDGARELDCDPLFIGREFYRYAPDYYESEYALSGVDVDLDVEVVLK